MVRTNGHRAREPQHRLLDDNWKSTRRAQAEAPATRDAQSIWTRQALDWVCEHPLVVLAGAMGTGVLLGWLVKRR